MSASLAALLYLVAGVLFILSLRGLSHPSSSRQGNLFGMIGMGIAVVTTLLYRIPSGFSAWLLVIVGIAIGGGFGAWRARTVQMTAMPQLVAFFHALVGLFDLAALGRQQHELRECRLHLRQWQLLLDGVQIGLTACQQPGIVQQSGLTDIVVLASLQ